MKPCQAGSESVESEHLLLALTRDVGSIAHELFSRAGLSQEEVRKEIQPRNPRRPGPPPGDIGHGDEVWEILQFAASEADRLGDRDVDSEHLLLGILHAERSVAASILRGHGIRLESARDQLANLRSQPSRPPGVYIAPTGRSATSEIGSDGHWALEGFDLRSALVRIASSDEMLFPGGRIELPPSLDPLARYDFLLVHGPDDGRDDRNELMRHGIEAYFGVTVQREDRPMDVYVLTAPDRRHPAIKEAGDSDGGGFVGSSWMEFSLADLGGEPPTAESLAARFRSLASGHEAMLAASIGAASMSNGSMAMLCGTLEQALDRPVVDETGLAGRYDIALSSGPGDLAERLRDELGLTLTPARRSVTWLTVRDLSQQR